VFNTADEAAARAADLNAAGERVRVRPIRVLTRAEGVRPGRELWVTVDPVEGDK
jgi:hypothetical protein